MAFGRRLVLQLPSLDVGEIANTFRMNRVLELPELLEKVMAHMPMRQLLLVSWAKVKLAMALRVYS